MAGKLPPKIKSLVKEWRTKNKDKLLEDWDRAQKSQELISIDPLI